jgi:hypothetical protein
MGSLRGWLRERLGRKPAQAVNLVARPEVQVAPPARLGLNVSVQVRPWSVARLASIFREAERFPAEESLRQARHARHCLSSFWLSAPIDQLKSLYDGEIGELQRNVLTSCLPVQPLAADELEWRDQLSQQLHQQWDAPERVNLLLALMPFFAPGGMKVEQAQEQVPDWLLKDYASYCDPLLSARLQQPVGFLQPSSPAEETTSEATRNAALALSERRGQDALSLFEQAEVVNRMAALINLYGLDPGDDATRSELAGLRDTIAQLWLDVHPDQLEKLYRTPVGTVHRSLITSGFSREMVNEKDQLTRRELASRVEDLSQPSAINNLLASLLYFEHGKVEFVAGQEFIPKWLQEELAQM